jgi:transporter family-2 protein
MVSRIPSVALVAAAGGTIIQARLNAQLVEITRNPLEVSLINLTVAAVVASLVILVAPTLRASWWVLLRAIKSGELRPWQLTGGALGGYYIAIQGSASLAVGVAVFTIAVVAGQTGTALLVDRLGIGPMGRKDISAARIAAALLAVLAVATAASGRIGRADISAFASIGVLSLAASAGAASAFQQAVSGRVGAVTRHGITAAWLNFVVGAGIMAGVVAMVNVARGPAWAPIPTDHWWMVIAGVFGLIYIATVTWVVRTVGVLVTSLLTLVGLLVGSVISDVVAPTTGSVITWQLIVGLVLTWFAVMLASKTSHR